VAHSTIAVESQKPQPTGDKSPPAATMVGERKSLCSGRRVICTAIDFLPFEVQSNRVNRH
jgi:hypothetical protein